jgi:hypothetical protein
MLSQQPNWIFIPSTDDYSSKGGNNWLEFVGVTRVLTTEELKVIPSRSSRLNLPQRVTKYLW